MDLKTGALAAQEEVQLVPAVHLEERDYNRDLRMADLAITELPADQAKQQVLAEAAPENLVLLEQKDLILTEAPAETDWIFLRNSDLISEKTDFLPAAVAAGEMMVTEAMLRRAAWEASAAAEPAADLDRESLIAEKMDNQIPEEEEEVVEMELTQVQEMVHPAAPASSS